MGNAEVVPAFGDFKLEMGRRMSISKVPKPWGLKGK